MAVLSAGVFLMAGNDEASATKVMDIVSYPDLMTAPATIDTTTLSDWMHQYIPGLIDTGGNLECPGLMDAQSLPKIGTTVHYGYIGFWFGGTKGADGNVTPTGSALKIGWEGDLTVTLSGGGVDAAVPVNAIVTPGSQPKITYGTISGTSLLSATGGVTNTTQTFVATASQTDFTLAHDAIADPTVVVNSQPVVVTWSSSDPDTVTIPACSANDVVMVSYFYNA